MAASVAIEKTFVSGSEETSISEDSDCIFDIRSHRPWKRSLFDDGNFEPTSFPASKKHRTALDDDDEEDPPMDEDYKKFMYTLEKYWKEHFQSLEEEEVGKEGEEEVGKKGEEEEEEEEDMDPQYGMFMENLREDGKSYMLEIYGEDVMPLCIKYEGEDKPSGGSGNKWATPGDEEKSHSATSAGEDIANSATPGEDGTSTTTGERYSRNATIPREEDEKILATPGKEGRRNSSALREEDRRNSATPRNEDRRDSTTSRVKKHWWNVTRMEGKKSLEVPYNEPNIMNEVKMETSYPTNRVSNEADWGSAVNPEIYQLHPNRRQLENIAADILAKCGKRLRYENNDGESFIHARKIVTNSAVKLEDDDEGTIAGKEKLADTKRLPMNSSMDILNQWHAKKMTGGARAQFRERLLEILSIPYNQREYKELWHEITDRKPMKRHRDLRGRIIVYDAGPGKSYLDYYSDLAKKINLVRLDHAEVLNLLRGFFYWLTNLSHEGAFRPWLDSSCLEVEQLDVTSE